MDYPAKNEKELGFAIRNHLFKEAWSKNAESYRLRNKTSKDYRKIDWSNKSIMVASEVKQCFPLKEVLPSWLKLIKNGTIRKLKKNLNDGNRYPAIDVKEELLRREIACQEDDLFWTKAKKYNRAKRDEYGKKVVLHLTKAQKRKIKRRQDREEAKRAKEERQK